MRSKRDTAELLENSIGNAALVSDSSRGPENEEWAWMVDEDPAFYLSQIGRTENTGE